jgi:hypothetical protein
MLALGMAQHRTRQQKIVAKLRRELALKEEKIKYTSPGIKEKSVDVKPVYYQPELTLPVAMVFADLTKTLAVTILALALQIGLAIWLSKGGWQWINSAWFHGLIK